MAELRELAALTGAAVIVTDHIPKRAPGEKDGDRGIMGSVAKSAQARAVHILSRVDPKECDGQNLMRWEVHKQSFAPRLEPFGVRLVIEGDDLDPARLVWVERCDLPGEENGQDRAERAVTRFLEARAGETFKRSEILEVAISGGNLRERWAVEAMKKAFGAFGDRLEKFTGTGKGVPLSFRLKPLPKTDETPDSSEDHLMQSLPLNSQGTTSNVDTSGTYKSDFMHSETITGDKANPVYNVPSASNAQDTVLHGESFRVVVGASSAGSASNTNSKKPDLEAYIFGAIEKDGRVKIETIAQNFGMTLSEVLEVIETLMSEGKVEKFAGSWLTLPVAKPAPRAAGVSLTPELEARAVSIRGNLKQAERRLLDGALESARRGNVDAVAQVLELIGIGQNSKIKA